MVVRKKSFLRDATVTGQVQVLVHDTEGLW